MKKTMYLAVPFTVTGSIVEPVGILKETKHYVWVKNWQGKEIKHAKRTPTASYFDTEKDAWQWIAKKLEELLHAYVENIRQDFEVKQANLLYVNKQLKAHDTN